MKRAVAGLVAAATLFLGAGLALAGEGLDIKEMLSQPGVKLVVVEFYATWCKPCMAAVPKWEALRKKYEQDGLRFIVISVKDEDKCVSPGWTPDQMICDDEGDLMSRFGAKGLPAAYLWSWQGHLLAKAAHVDEVEAKIKAWMRRAPRVDVEVGSLVRGSGISKKSLLNSVRSELQANGKLVVVATARERESLRAIMRRSLASSADEALACEVGKEVSANSLVKVSISAKRGRKRLRLRLFSAERGCMVASGSSTWYAKNPRRSLSEASAKLLAQLRLSAPQSPRSGGLAAIMSTPRMSTPALAETSYEDLLAEAAAATAEAAAATAKVEAVKKAREAAEAAQRAKVEKARAARLAKIERAWASVSKIMGTTALDKGRRAGAVQRFLSDYPNDNPHLQTAQAGLAALKRGKEPNGGGSRGAATGALNWVYSRPARLEMMRAEVTVAQYKGCVDAGRCKRDFKTKSDDKYCNWGYSGRGNHPMNCVNWHGADAFCRWAGGRLPTEHEWFAEASNNKTRQYPWGSQKATCARAVMDDGATKGSAGSETDGCGEDRTWPVCSKRKGDSVSGICDTSGNVWEWTSSQNESERVSRGGSWLDDFRSGVRAARGRSVVRDRQPRLSLRSFRPPVVC